MRNSAPIAVLLILLSGSAGADDEPPPGEVETGAVEVRGREEARSAATQAEGAERALEDPGFVTEVHAGRASGEAAPVAEVLAESAGVNVRSLGGLGAFSALSVRGAPAGQTQIFIDGVPLSRLAVSTADVGALELGAFHRVDVYRGGAPVELGGAVLGGAVNFVTGAGPGADGKKNRVTLGGGSFGARRLRLERRDAFDDDDVGTTFGLVYGGATGDYPYFDDNGTPYNASDDRVIPRANNGYDHLEALGRVRIRSGDGLLLEGGARALARDQGVPGPAGVTAEHTSLRTFRVLADTTVRQLGALGWDRLDLGAGAHVFAETQRWQDPMSEVGLGVQDTTYDTLGAGLAARARLAVGTRQLVSLGVEARWEAFVEEDRVSEGRVDGRRLAGAASLSDEIVLGPSDDVVLVPAVRFDVLGTDAEGAMAALGTTGPPASRTDTFVSPRVGARWRALAWLSVKANAGRYFRPPTLVEVFGDRGFVVGNPELRPESGMTGDVGFVLAPPGRVGVLDRIYLETALFASRSTDLIALVPTAARVARATNLSDVFLFGQEVAVAVRAFGLVTLTGNYTFLDSEQRSDIVSFDGKRLPGRPRHEVYARLAGDDVLWERDFGAYTDVTYVSGNFLDAGNNEEVPPRFFVGAGVKGGIVPGLTLTVEVKNLLDETVEDIAVSSSRTIPRSVSDVLGYPLPGRAFYATLDATF